MMVLSYHFFQCFLNSPWDKFDGGWVLEDNEEMVTVLEQSNAYKGRGYRIYQKSLK